MNPLITLLTDFGTADGYVGEMKGVLLTALTGATIVDIAHDIAPQDTEGARLAVARYWRRYPPKSVHLGVVDPGVGTSRAAIAVASDGRFLTAPRYGDSDASSTIQAIEKGIEGKEVTPSMLTTVVLSSPEFQRR